MKKRDYKRLMEKLRRIERLMEYLIAPDQTKRPTIVRDAKSGGS